MAMYVTKSDTTRVSVRSMRSGGSSKWPGAAEPRTLRPRLMPVIFSIRHGQNM